MELTPELREQIRLSLLRYCLARTRPGLLRANLRGEGVPLDREALELELLYLADKGYLVSEEKTISPENKFWRTTAAGRDYLAGQREEKA